MRRSAVVLLVVVLLAAGIGVAIRLTHPGGGRGSSDGAVRPQVDGNLLVDARTGDPWVPRGISWGSFDYACAQGWGYSALDALGSDAEADQAALLASWGVDTVRLPLNQDCWVHTRGAPVSDEYAERTAPGYRAAVEDFVQALHDQGLVVILDLATRKRIGTPEFGRVATPDSGSLLFWRSVATVFRDDPSVMFEAYDEPASREELRRDRSGRPIFELTWDCWERGGCHPPVEDDQSPTNGLDTYDAVGMSDLVATIREVGARQPVVLGGLDRANDLSQWLAHAPDDDQLVASFHEDDTRRCADRACWDRVLAPLAEQVPVLTTSVATQDPGPAGFAFVDRYLRWAGQHGIGSVVVTWADLVGDPTALVRDLDGTPTPWGKQVQDWWRQAS